MPSRSCDAIRLPRERLAHGTLAPAAIRREAEAQARREAEEEARVHEKARLHSLSTS